MSTYCLYLLMSHGMPTGDNRQTYQLPISSHTDPNAGLASLH